MSVKNALCIGINYVGTEYELRGCINDADDWGSFLNKAGFSVALLPEKQATKGNIVGAMTYLITGLKPGDVGVITYSGHGTWVPDLDGDEPDGRDEALCPIDMGDEGENILIDDEIHLIFNKIAPGAHVVFITDSCHSGTVYRFAAPGVPQHSYRRARYIPPSHFLKGESLQKMNLAYGQPGRHGQMTDAPLPGLVHYSGCKDNEYSNDAEFNGRANGAMTYFALKAFNGALAASASYHDAWKGLRSFLPSWDYQQTPLLNTPADLKKRRLFS